MGGSTETKGGTTLDPQMAAAIFGPEGTVPEARRLYLDQRANPFNEIQAQGYQRAVDNLTGGQWIDHTNQSNDMAAKMMGLTGENYKPSNIQKGQKIDVRGLLQSMALAPPKSGLGLLDVPGAIPDLTAEEELRKRKNGRYDQGGGA